MRRERRATRMTGECEPCVRACAMELPVPKVSAPYLLRCGCPKPWLGVPRISARRGRWDHRAAMNLSPSPLMRRLSVAAGALLLSAVAAGPALAAGHGAQLRADRPGAQRALRGAAALARGQGVRSGRELTPALATLAARRPALSPADRAAAGALLARPTDPSQTGQPGGPYTVPDVQAYSQHYCYHWVTTTADAPSMADSDQDGIPDYIVELADVFEHVYATEHGELGWFLPKSDGARGGC